MVFGGKAKAAEEPKGPSVADAAAMLLKAVHSNDVTAVEAALRLAHQACTDEYAGEPDGDEG
jgi:hypothetical protein